LEVWQLEYGKPRQTTNKPTLHVKQVTVLVMLLMLFYLSELKMELAKTHDRPSNIPSVQLATPVITTFQY
jgi:hypothetical protein